MLKQKYGILLMLVLCASHVSVYGLRQGTTNVPQNEEEIVQPPVVVSQFRYVQYYPNSTNVTVHFTTGHFLHMPHGLTPYYAFQLQGTPNNLAAIQNINGNRP